MLSAMPICYTAKSIVKTGRFDKVNVETCAQRYRSTCENTHKNSEYDVSVE
jgi:pheromone shutdown protein TraB